jgi:cytochrome c556
MEDHLQSALDKKDAPALAKGLTRAATFVPDPSWNAGAQGWAALANAGADAAKSGDIAATQATCKSCHKAWRSKYKSMFRTRAIAD